MQVVGRNFSMRASLLGLILLVGFQATAETDIEYAKQNSGGRDIKVVQTDTGEFVVKVAAWDYRLNPMTHPSWHTHISWIGPSAFAKALGVATAVDHYRNRVLPEEFLKTVRQMDFRIPIGSCETKPDQKLARCDARNVTIKFTRFDESVSTVKADKLLMSLYQNTYTQQYHTKRIHSNRYRYVKVKAQVGPDHDPLSASLVESVWNSVLNKEE